MSIMEQPYWIAGSEERFSEFISSIGETERIAVVSHNADLDGISAAKIICSAILASDIFLVNYHELNETFVTKLRERGVTRIIVSDMNFKRRDEIMKLEEFARVLIIDHHQFREDFNSVRTVFMNAQDMSAAYLCYCLFSKIKNLETLAWVAACASLSDWAWKQNQGFLSETLRHYGEQFIGGEDGIKLGKFWEFQYQLYLALVYYRKLGREREFYDAFPEHFGELGVLAEHTADVQTEINRARGVFAREQEVIHDRVFWEFRGAYPAREVIINMVSHANPHKTFIFVEQAGDIYKVSLRRQDQRENVSLLIQTLVAGFANAGGGGHIAAAGGNFPEKSLVEFKERLKTI